MAANTFNSPGQTHDIKMGQLPCLNITSFKPQNVAVLLFFASRLPPSDHQHPEEKPLEGAGPACNQEEQGGCLFLVHLYRMTHKLAAKPVQSPTAEHVPAPKAYNLCAAHPLRFTPVSIATLVICLFSPAFNPPPPVGKPWFMGTAEVTYPGISSHRAQGQKTSLILTYSQLDMMSCFQQSADPLWTNPSKRNPMLEMMFRDGTYSRINQEFHHNRALMSVCGPFKDCPYLTLPDRDTLTKLSSQRHRYAWSHRCQPL
ncbi:unnamed protein product [Leuciscus chuanchicus]